MLNGMIKLLKLVARLAIAIIVLAVILIATSMVNADDASPSICSSGESTAALNVPESENAGAVEIVGTPEPAETQELTGDETTKNVQVHTVDTGSPILTITDRSAASGEAPETKDEQKPPETPEVTAQGETSSESALQPDTSVLSNWPKLKVENELDMLACAIYKEAGGDACSDETRMMVGNVILNRVSHPDFPNTVKEVLVAPFQYNTFSWTGIVWPDCATSDVEHHAVDRAYECAQRLLDGERVFDESVIWQSGEFQGTELVSYQDGIYFCR